MLHFDELFDIAAGRHGGADALNGMLGVPTPAAELSQVPEDRWLAQFTKCIFQAGFQLAIR